MYKTVSKLVLCSAFSLSLLANTAGNAEAQNPEDPAFKKELSYDLSGFVGLPLGDFGDFADLGLGATAAVHYSLAPQLDASARTGLVYYLLDVDGPSFYEVPLWLGARYYIGDREGPFVGGDLAINYYVASSNGSSDSSTELGVNLVGGLHHGSILIEGGLYLGRLDGNDKRAMLGVNIGTSF